LTLSPHKKAAGMAKHEHMQKGIRKRAENDTPEESNRR
jgi:hypothetical protein